MTSPLYMLKEFAMTSSCKQAYSSYKTNTTEPQPCSRKMLPHPVVRQACKQSKATLLKHLIINQIIPHIHQMFVHKQEIEQQLIVGLLCQLEQQQIKDLQ